MKTEKVLFSNLKQPHQLIGRKYNRIIAMNSILSSTFPITC